MREIFAADQQATDMLSLVAPGNIGVFYIAALSVNSLFLIVSIPSVMGNCAAGRTEMDGRVGFMFGTFVKRVCTIAWCLTAVAAMAYYLKHGITVEPDKVYGDVAFRFLPQLLPGMLGIFIASLLASVMSSCDSFMIASAGLFTENLYKPFRPEQTSTHYVWVGRVASLVIVMAGLVLAYSFTDVVEGLKVWLKVGPMMGIAFWLGLLWRRATVVGAWASTLAGFATWWLITQAWFVDWISGLAVAETLGLIVQSKGKLAIYDPWQYTCYLGVGVLAGVMVSLLTRPVDPQRLDLFYALTRTPIQPCEELSAGNEQGATEEQQPCTLPPGVVPPERKMLLQRWGFEIPLPSKVSVIGFLVGWGCIAVLIGGFSWYVG